MSIFVLTISTPSPAFDKRSSEIAFIQYATSEAMKELGRGNGNVQSGNVVGTANNGTANTSLGSWTYAPFASLP